MGGPCYALHVDVQHPTSFMLDKCEYVVLCAPAGAACLFVSAHKVVNSREANNKREDKIRTSEAKSKRESHSHVTESGGEQRRDRDERGGLASTRAKQN